MYGGKAISVRQCSRRSNSDASLLDDEIYSRWQVFEYRCSTHEWHNAVG